MEQLVGSEAERLDIHTHRVHVEEPDLDRFHLGAKVGQLASVHLLGELVSELKWQPAETVRLRFDQGGGRTALAVTVDIYDLAGAQRLVSSGIVTSCTI
jgi:hypothetical protein